jgi:hypothetical protein
MDNNEIQGLQIYLIDPSENGRNIWCWYNQMDMMNISDDADSECWFLEILAIICSLN